MPDDFVIKEEYGKALKQYEDQALQQATSQIAKTTENNETLFITFLNTLRDSAYKEYITIKNDESSDSESLLLESQLWSLLRHLVESEQEDFTISENSELNRVIYLKKWLESIHSAPLRPLNLKKFETNNGAHEKPDFEEANENSFFQYCFEILLTGDFEKAVKECVSVNNFPLAMIISGYKTVEIQQTQKLENILWRKTVSKLSDNTSLNKYERIIYKYLSGSVIFENEDELGELMSNSYSWECHLLFFLKALLDSFLEASSNNFSSVNITTELRSGLDLVFGTTSKHNNIQDIIAALILKTENEFFASAKDNLIKTFETEEITQFKTENYLLRVLTHVIIILDIFKSGIKDSEIKNLFLSTYISCLRLNKLHSFIPSYVLFLNGPQRLVTYANVLNDVTSVEDKEEQKILSLQLGLPYKDSLRKMAEDLFQNLTEDAIEEDVFLNNIITTNHKEIINCIDWLMVASLNNEAINLLIASIKFFLLNGSVGTFRLVVEKINFSQLIAICELDNKPFESSILNQLLELNNCFSILDEWHNMATNIKEVKNLSTFAGKQRNLAEKILHCILHFFKDVDVTEHVHFYKIKVLYVPYLVIQLHQALDFASDILCQKSLAEDALDLAAMVAHDEGETYKLFQLSNKVEEYIQIATKTYVKVYDK